jgi:hypothetical protein
MDATMEFEVVEKENIPSLIFPSEHIERNTQEEALLRKELENATILGNIEKNKIKIYFEDNEGLKLVETTIWATGDENITLKAGVVVPIHRIRKIDIV